MNRWLYCIEPQGWGTKLVRVSTLQSGKAQRQRCPRKCRGCSDNETAGQCKYDPDQEKKKHNSPVKRCGDGEVMR